MRALGWFGWAYVAATTATVAVHGGEGLAMVWLGWCWVSWLAVRAALDVCAPRGPKRPWINPRGWRE